MQQLNLPAVDLKICKKEGKQFVFDQLRKQYVRFTPEEEVRQTFISFLIREKGYPEGLLANEVCIRLGDVNRRCDSVLYDTSLCPVMILEYKAPSVIINQNTFDQIARYTISLPATWLIISNGLQHFCFHKDKKSGEYSFFKDIPHFNSLF
ncbi:type I restriction enzyme HsdR N-terminal domain-containing protein [Bacteroidales bacterium OttesenSCG-928-M11]|nr:type I restriction enzyme HsdR N-terminal domain-containing protein [Bacteroidales bacterium OttesenSCG-928-M11]